MSVLDSLPLMLFVMLMVFAVLASLFLLIQIFTVLLRRIAFRRASNKLASVTISTEGPDESSEEQHQGGDQLPDGAAYGGELVLRDVDEPTAALIMAIVSDETKIPLAELCFRSIRKKA